jgi:hypothetical protein
LIFTLAGLEKMPEPIIKPMTRLRPFRYVRDLCFSKDPPLRACVASNPPAVGVPIAVYPPLVWDRGKRFEAKSKAEETEYERSCLPLVAPFAPDGAKGSSSENESFREEGVPDAEEDIEERREGVVVEAKDASSRESR